MWSDYSLEVVDAVARNGSFSAAAQELHRVPSAMSYTVRQLEEWLAVPLFERRHRDVELTPAGALFLKEGRSVIKKMQITRQQCQQIANGWRGHLSIAVDNIVKPQRTRQLIVDFYRHFSDVELRVSQPEVFNGVWDALADGRAEMAIGATQAIPVGGGFAFRDMGDAELAVRGQPASSAGAIDRAAERRSAAAVPFAGAWRIPPVQSAQAYHLAAGQPAAGGGPGLDIGARRASAPGCASGWCRHIGRCRGCSAVS